MREIKFRGKRKDNGEWVYGSLIVDRNHNACIIDYADHVSESYTWHDVDPESVGQYTGLKDKNGKEIYEGDIIILSHWKSSDLFDYSSPFVVEYWEGEINFKQGQYNNFKGSLIGKKQYEIVGNIYENPEQINSEQKDQTINGASQVK